MKLFSNTIKKVLTVLLVMALVTAVFPNSFAEAAKKSSMKKKLAKLAKLETGDTFELGSLEQDCNLKNGKEPIEWIVLSNSDGELLALSSEVLAYEPMNDNTEPEDLTWADCTLRKWLNKTFFKQIFTKKERSIIKTVELENKDNEEFGTKGGKNTKDKIFLLTAEDVTNPDYGFSPDPQERDINRRVSPILPLIEEGMTVYKSYPTRRKGATVPWALRSPTAVQTRLASVTDGGIVVYNDTRDYLGAKNQVRPAIVIDLNAK